MRNFWKSLQAALPPTWRISPDPRRREAFLKFAIVVAIMLVSGPELIPALEMRILLEILGATLFTAAFIAGGRLVLLGLEAQLRGLWRKGLSGTYTAAHAQWWLGAVAVIAVGLVSLWKLLAP
jgi:hypothetical protein